MGRKPVKEYRERIIEALKEGLVKVEDIQEATGIPRRTIYNVLSEMKERGEVLHIGRGKGYILRSVEVYKKLYKESISAKEISLVVKACEGLVKDAITCPSKKVYEKLIRKAQKILIYTISILFIDSVADTYRIQSREEREALAEIVIEAFVDLFSLSLKLLDSSRNRVTWRMLKKLREKFMEEAFKEVDSYTETVKRVASHLLKTSRYSPKA